ncbi:autoinducer 2 kinase LsrK [Anaerotignum neopropionicum]|uniref:Autoinducer 2 kinase LsrK n=1 Tax=Anaerotignum neopropionicum TaxID=36847 RepID=A0A136WIE4_9FIRM|nr:autoinducer-2 kinase [Anaerotignum neopropionicum]KXL54247.1 autoinducer 2 kinase LsrK [Anaerotignum neopropionicum]KXL54372.1 autoinducer 2 kinase LsrK [Anaerotignum neopropionicum]
MAQYLMAIDAGTGSVRAVIFDTDGKQLCVAQQEWAHKEDPRYPGSMDFDWTHNWGLAAQCVREVLRESGINPTEIAAIATTSMREGIVLYDEGGKEIWACANVDARSTDEVIQLQKISQGLENEIYLPSGQTFALGALPRILWVKNHLPEIYEKTKTVTMFNDWLIAKLTGLLTAEPSNGCTTGIFDLSKRDWLPEIAEKCGLKSDIFPPVYESGTVIGEVSRECAARTGLAEGTPVVTGGGDAQLGCVGVGLVEPNQGAIFGGSFWQFEFNTDEAKTDPACRVRVNCHAVPGLWQYEALAFYPGLIMRWYRDAFCQWEKAEAEKTDVDPYNLMNAEAAKIPPGCYGMLCTFSDVMDFIHWKHAAPSFINFSINPDKFNKYTFYRALMENAALVTKGNVELVSELTGKRLDSVIFASGASKSPIWCQILSDVLGIPVKVPKVKEATALGAAITAGIGVGIYHNLSDTAKELVRWDAEYQPNMENHKIYSEIYINWRNIYKDSLELTNQKLTTPMWAAPGL